MRKFVLIGVPRVGSNYLVNVLNMHPNIVCHYEVFSKDAVYLAFDANAFLERPELNKFKNIDFRESNHFNFLNQLLVESRSDVIGFNIFPEQCGEVLESIVDDASYKKVFILRSNQLRSYISLQIAKRNNAWNSIKSKALSLADKRFHLDTSDFDLYRKASSNFYENIMQSLNKRGEPFHIIKYEDLVSDRSALNELFTFLGVSSQLNSKRESVFKKENGESISELIINYQELLEYCETNDLAYLE